ERPLKLRARLKREAIAEAGGNAAVSARVVDREGKPVAEAAMVLTETTYGPDGESFLGRRYHPLGTTDADGRVRKPHDLIKGAGWWFRCRGGYITPEAGSARLVLRRVDEPSGRSATPLGPALPRPDVVAIARAMIAADVHRILASQDRDVQGRLLEALARIDPE